MTTGTELASAAPAMSAADSPLLRAYDAQLRGDAEVLDAREVDRDGPIVRAVFDGAWGFVGYRSLAGYDGPADGGRLDGLISRAIDRFDRDPRVATFEWKTRGHDLPADLTDRLLERGFEAHEPETVMAGQAALLAGAIINPRRYSPAHPNARLLRRQAIILRRMGEVTPPSSSDTPAEIIK